MLFVLILWLFSDQCYCQPANASPFMGCISGFTVYPLSQSSLLYSIISWCALCKLRLDSCDYQSFSEPEDLLVVFFQDIQSQLPSASYKDILALHAEKCSLKTSLSALPFIAGYSNKPTD